MTQCMAVGIADVAIDAGAAGKVGAEAAGDVAVGDVGGVLIVVGVAVVADAAAGLAATCFAAAALAAAAAGVATADLVTAVAGAEMRAQRAAEALLKLMNLPQMTLLTFAAAATIEPP